MTKFQTLSIIIKHEAFQQCGSFEIRFPDGRPSRYFYWDALPSRRLNPQTLEPEVALEKAKSLERPDKQVEMSYRRLASTTRFCYLSSQRGN